ncbi:MAG: mechanosensitive ion channel family protein [Chlorobi bacterium]|nr:mechanosensitive ion channel family protein [Chlorobiota bacterium]
MKAYVIFLQSALQETAQAAVNPVNNLIASVMDALGRWTPKVLGAIVALIIGLWIVALLTRMFRKAISRTKMDPTLIPFLTTLVNLTLKLVLFLGIAQVLGFGITSFAAILVGVGAAIGGAFNGSLGNIASGVMLLIFRPFKVGDLIQLPDGTLGFVEEISVFVTVLRTFQNKTEIIPNATVTAGKITNYSTLGHLRVDMPFAIRYGSDIEKAKKVVMGVLENDPKVMKDPAPRVAVNNLGDSAVELLALPYATTDDYWDVYWDTRQKIVEALGQAGFDPPYPQRVITMVNDK